MEVRTDSCYFAMKLCKTLASLLTVFAALLRARQRTLSLLELFHSPLKRLGRLDFLAVRTRAEGFEPCVESQYLGFMNCRLRRGFCLVLFVQD